MSIKKNPYGVGYSGDNFEWQDARCRCCRQPFLAKVYAMHGVPWWCTGCEAHAPAESDTLEVENARLKQHEEIYLERLSWFREKITEQQQKVKERQQQTKSALASRDKWRTILTEVRALHEQTADGKKCTCNSAWRCETRRALDMDPYRAEALATRAYQDLLRKERPFLTAPGALEDW